MNESERAALVEIVAEIMYENDGQHTSHGSYGRLEFKDAWDGKKNRYRQNANSVIRAIEDNRLLAAGTAPGLDELLDSVPGMFLDSLHDGKKGPSSPHWYEEPAPEKRWTARVIVRQGVAGRTGYWVTQYHGTGPTRMEAIANAVAQATGTTQEGTSDE